MRENFQKVPQKSKTWEGFNYSLGQEKYLKVFLDDGEVPLDNNVAEQSIRGFCIGKKNWVMTYDGCSCLTDWFELSVMYEGEDYGAEGRYEYRDRTISMEEFEAIRDSID